MAWKSAWSAFVNESYPYEHGMQLKPSLSYLSKHWQSGFGGNTQLSLVGSGIVGGEQFVQAKQLSLVPRSWLDKHVGA